MNIRLHPPLAIHDQGRRDNNEDSIYPRPEDGLGAKDNQLFLVCDGVGGLEKGEVASKIVCETLWDTLRHEKVLQSKSINSAIGMAEQRIDQFIIGNQEAKGMATTLTLLAVHPQGVTIAHIGDSRVYHIRNGECLFKTTDHSLINDLLSKNIITAEEALNHPQRNVITKAISGYAAHQEADVKYIIDVQTGDYFFLCTDGVQESFSDEELFHLLKEKFSNEDKINFIKTKCQRNSKDNFSAYLIQIESVKAEMNIAEKLSWTTLFSGEDKKILYTALAIAAGIFITVFLNGNSTKSADEVEQENIESALEKLHELDTMKISSAPVLETDNSAKQEVEVAPELKTSVKKKAGKVNKKTATIKKNAVPKDISLEELFEMDSYEFEEALDLSLIKEEKSEKSSSNSETPEINPAALDDDQSVPVDTTKFKKRSVPIDSSQLKKG